jgi:hypothetical protein
MSQPIARGPRPAAIVEDDVFAEYSMFALQAQFSAVTPLELGHPETDEILRAGDGGATFCSGAADHFARVRVEIWLEPPLLPAEGWEETAEGTAHLDSTELRLASATAGVSDRPAHLPAPGTYAIQAAVSGRAAIRDRVMHDLRTGSFEPPSGIERWLVRLWPVASR